MASLWIHCLILTTLTIATAANYDQDLFHDTTGCTSLHITDTAVAFNQSDTSISCLHIVGSKGSWIRVDLQVNSTWSVASDFIYVQTHNPCEDHNILELTNASRLCSTLFKTIALDMYIKGSVDMTFSSFQADIDSSHSSCDPGGFQDQRLHYEHCFDLTDYDEVHVFPQQMMTYDDIVQQHPSLNITASIPDASFQSSELPPLNLDITGKFI